jgi:hypothetical protein
MTKIIAIISVILLILNASCNKDDSKDQESMWYTENFVWGYVDNVQSFYISDIYFSLDNLNNILFYACQLRCRDNNSYAVNKESDPVRFDSLSRYYKDTSYNNLKNIGDPPCLAEPLLSISVVSDADYDDIHPAGTLLDDIVKLNALSPWKFIQSGYKNKMIIRNLP